MSYSYNDDSWGNCITTPHNVSGANSYASFNPFRYRGYYYDAELGFYYLNSRYYDPSVGRFINADALVSTGQGILGYNMFAYCGNTPVNGCDPCGTCIHRWDIWNDCQKCGGQTIGDKWNGFTNWCSNTYNKTKDFVTNTSEDTTRENLQTYGCSFYKGSLVFSTALPFDKTAFSYGIIVMDDYYISEKGESSFSNTLNHEYGHFIHMVQIGSLAYSITVAAPSLISAGLSNVSDWVKNNYYNLPWERIADKFGQVNRENTPHWANTVGSLYWTFTAIIACSS